jgi:transposase
MNKAIKPKRTVAVRKKAEQELAQLLYLREGLEVPAIAAQVEVNIKTVYAWAKKGSWEKLRLAQHMGKDNQLERVQSQLSELNAYIALKPEGQRYPSASEADTIKKLTSACRDLETKLGLRELVDVSVELIPFIKLINADDAKAMKAYLDRFIQHKVARQ